MGIRGEGQWHAVYDLGAFSTEAELSEIGSDVQHMG